MTALDVLIVDDDSDMRVTLVELLEDEGYAADSLADGRHLAQVIEERRPLVVLLDLSMPGFDLAQTSQTLRDQGLLHSTRVIVMSGRDRLFEVVERFGLHGSLSKPFDIGELLDVVGETSRPAEEQPSVSLPP